ncbi:TetR family transcriptional regulator [Actinocatenispora sera]|uniref:TetR family transcriptional regulator n=1 Tax=Actinocatenispora sera TaxID=390989 RepID=A0A810KZW8_9ACTN|nr:TetR family transcriptional regulator [Actinocatenispora sera]BCJ27548.1 TetR family transcriptional regulator [Actinocatenispora sera]
MTEAGLRERKKQQTRAALIAAAQRLFTEQGFDGTTTDEIAAAADVSQRTLFRYFAGKEEMALAPLAEMQEGFTDGVRRRPADEPPMTALQRAAREMIAGFAGDDAGSEQRRQILGSTIDLVNRTPALLAENLRRTVARGERLAQLLAEREGVDMADDPRPRLAVTTFDGALRVATLSSCDAAAIDPVLMGQELERCLAALPGIFRHWHRAEPVHKGQV